MHNVVSSLLAFIWKSLKYLADFLIILVLGIVGAILFALPWLLRLTSVLAWLVAGYLALTGINDFYQQYVSSPIPVLALQFALILLMVAWVMVGMMQKGVNAIWGFLAAGGIVVGGFFWKVLPWLFSRWPGFADLFFRVLPSALFIVLLIFTTMRLKWLHATRGAKLPSSAFKWFSPSGVHSITNEELDLNISERMEGGGVPNI